jgi:hypothetical protein
VYGWIWRRLPGNFPVKLVEGLVLVVGVLAILFLVLFPWVEPRLPWNNINIDSPSVSQLQAPASSGSPAETPGASVLPAG